jgi:hypothetical protein
VSARSALTKGSDGDNFCSHSPQKVQLGIGVVQGVHRPSEVQGCEPERQLKDYCCRSAQSRRDFIIWMCGKVAARSARKEFFFF